MFLQYSACFGCELVYRTSLHSTSDHHAVVYRFFYDVCSLLEGIMTSGGELAFFRGRPSCRGCKCLLGPGWMQSGVSLGIGLRLACQHSRRIRLAPVTCSHD